MVEAAQLLETPGREEVESFLYREAGLLDGRRFEQWLELFLPDAIYWIVGLDGEEPPSDIESRAWWAYDDLPALREKVFRVGSGAAYAQEPASQTRHLVNNVWINGERDGSLSVLSNFIVVELRKEEQHLYAGSFEHTLTVGGELGFRIARKKVILLNKSEPIGNLTFFL